MIRWGHEQEPAASLGHKLNLIGGWLPLLSLIVYDEEAN
jgi:hypothetical protein